MPAVVDIEEAAEPSAARIWSDNPNGNIGVTIAFGDKAAADAAFAKAKHVVKLRLQNNRITASSIEPRAALGAYDAASDSYTLYTTSQDPHGVRSKLASAIFNIPETKIRVVSPMSAAASG